MGFHRKLNEKVGKTYIAVSIENKILCECGRRESLLWSHPQIKKIWAHSHKMEEIKRE